MVKHGKAQAAFEYLTTYGWVIITALIVIGALAYFGFLNPSNLLPNKCDFGKQLECVEYRITSENSNVSLMLRNNFGKDISIIGVAAIENTVLTWGPNPRDIPLGAKKELNVILNYIKPAGDKQEVNLIITFKRAGVGSPSHNISGTVFVAVQ